MQHIQRLYNSKKEVLQEVTVTAANAEPLQIVVRVHLESVDKGIRNYLKLC